MTFRDNLLQCHYICGPRTNSISFTWTLLEIHILRHTKLESLGWVPETGALVSPPEEGTTHPFYLVTLIYRQNSRGLPSLHCWSA